MRSAEKYYAPQDVQEEETPRAEDEVAAGSDGLGHHGDPEGQSEVKEYREDTSPTVIRASGEPTQRERESHEATH